MKLVFSAVLYFLCSTALLCGAIFGTVGLARSISAGEFSARLEEVIGGAVSIVMAIVCALTGEEVEGE